jgi:hypothetical protein
LQKEIALMFRIAMAATLSVALTTGSLFSASKAEINDVKRQINDTKRLERDKLKEIDDHYKNILRRMDRPEDRQEARRNRLKRQEQNALKDVTDPTRKQQIKADYDKLRADLEKDIKAKEQAMGQKKKEWSNAKAQAKRQFGQRIKGLQTKLKNMQKGNKKPNKPKKKDKKPNKPKKKDKKPNKPKKKDKKK